MHLSQSHSARVIAFLNLLPTNLCTNYTFEHWSLILTFFSIFNQQLINLYQFPMTNQQLINQLVINLLFTGLQVSKLVLSNCSTVPPGQTILLPPGVFSHMCLSWPPKWCPWTSKRTQNGPLETKKNTEFKKKTIYSQAYLHFQVYHLISTLQTGFSIPANPCRQQIRSQLVARGAGGRGEALRYQNRQNQTLKHHVPNILILFNRSVLFSMQQTSFADLANPYRCNLAARRLPEGRAAGAKH